MSQSGVKQVKVEHAAEAAMQHQVSFKPMSFWLTNFVHGLPWGSAWRTALLDTTVAHQQQSTGSCTHVKVPSTHDGYHMGEVCV